VVVGVEAVVFEAAVFDSGLKADGCGVLDIAGAPGMALETELVLEDEVVAIGTIDLNQISKVGFTFTDRTAEPSVIGASLGLSVELFPYLMPDVRGTRTSMLVKLVSLHQRVVEKLPVVGAGFGTVEPALAHCMASAAAIAEVSAF
jgi:hypothetical protein